MPCTTGRGRPGDCLGRSFRSGRMTLLSSVKVTQLTTVYRSTWVPSQLCECSKAPRSPPTGLAIAAWPKCCCRPRAPGAEKAGAETSEGLGCGSASRADQGRRRTGNRRTVQVLLLPPIIAAGRSGRGQTTTTPGAPAEARSPRRSRRERRTPLPWSLSECWTVEVKPTVAI